jgi:hypothetical protein
MYTLKGFDDGLYPGLFGFLTLCIVYKKVKSLFTFLKNIRLWIKSKIPTILNGFYALYSSTYNIWGDEI